MKTLAPRTLISKLRTKKSNDRLTADGLIRSFAFILLPSSLSFNHLLRVPAGLVGNLKAAEHARHLVDPLRRLELFYRRHRSAFADLLEHDVMGVGQGGDLGQMGDADNLMGGGHLFQFLADDLGDAAADAGVDFVKQKGWDVAGREHER